jgi:nickel-dependent lactate racemase
MGIGEEGFVKLLSQAKNPKEVLEKIKCEYRLGHHKAAKIAELALNAKIFAVTDLDDEVLISVFMTPYKNIQHAIDDALKEKGKDAKLIVLQNGSITVPRVEK